MRLRKRRFFCGKVEKGKQMEERKPLIPVKELAKWYALFIISLFISALGVAISTIIAAVLTGFVVKFWNKLVRKPLLRSSSLSESSCAAGIIPNQCGVLNGSSPRGCFLCCKLPRSTADSFDRAVPPDPNRTASAALNLRTV